MMDIQQNSSRPGLDPGPVNGEHVIWYIVWSQHHDRHLTAKHIHMVNHMILGLSGGQTSYERSWWLQVIFVPTSAEIAEK